jgi:hypothetical protein
MAIWFWLALVLNVAVWTTYFYRLSRRKWTFAALIVGTLHMLFSVILSVAPFRSFLEPNYPGLGLGFFRFEGMAATLPAALIFGWAVSAAWLAVGKGRGRWMTLIVVGDIFLALNFGGSTLLEGRADNWRIEFGSGRSLSGFAGAFILLFVFTFPFVASAIWAASRSRSNRAAPPLSSDLQERRNHNEDQTKGGNDLRLSESCV